MSIWFTYNNFRSFCIIITSMYYFYFFDRCFMFIQFSNSFCTRSIPLYSNFWRFYIISSSRYQFNFNYFIISYNRISFLFDCIFSYRVDSQQRKRGPEFRYADHFKYDSSVHGRYICNPATEFHPVNCPVADSFFNTDDDDDADYFYRSHPYQLFTFQWHYFRSYNRFPNIGPGHNRYDLVDGKNISGWYSHVR